MNKAKYYLTNNDNIIAIVYESDKYGRTLAIRGVINPEFEIKIWSTSETKMINDIDLIEFLSSMIPAERK